MGTHVRLACAGLAAAVLLAFAVAGASARNFQLSSALWRATWTAFLLRSTGGTEIRCRLTLEGTFAGTTMTKAVATVGAVTRAIFGPCEGGGAFALSETLPWSVRYESFGEALPNIREIAVGVIGLGVEASESWGFFRCLAWSEAETPAIFLFFREAGGRLLTVRAGGTLPLRGPTCLAGGAGIFSGTGEVFRFDSTARITMTLI
jgi:hypothetical protein